MNEYLSAKGIAKKTELGNFVQENQANFIPYIEKAELPQFFVGFSHISMFNRWTRCRSSRYAGCRLKAMVAL